MIAWVASWWNWSQHEGCLRKKTFSFQQKMHLLRKEEGCNILKLKLRFSSWRKAEIFKESEADLNPSSNRGQHVDCGRKGKNEVVDIKWKYGGWANAFAGKLIISFFSRFFLFLFLEVGYTFEAWFTASNFSNHNNWIRGENVTWIQTGVKF